MSDGLILVVDDEAIIREMICRILNAEGYTTIDVKDAAEALQVWMDLRSSVRLVITDHQMPGMYGATLANRLVEKGATIPIILISGAARSIGELGASVPASASFLPKPFTPAVLLTHVEMTLSMRHS